MSAQVSKEEKKGLNISTKSFLTAIVVIFVLMILTLVLTYIVPGGEYARVEDEMGNLIIDTNQGFTNVEGGIPFWKWILSPFLVLGAEGNVSLIAVLIFLLVIGGVFSSLDHCGLMKYLLDRITWKFGERKYLLLAMVSLFFMAMGSFIGSFEECIPLVPIVVALAIRLGWDVLTGLGMSLLSIGCGFAAGICNPFTVGVAQELAGLPMFSGMWFRAVAFVLIYSLLLSFLFRHAKKVEKKDADGPTATAFKKTPEMDKGLMWFVGLLCLLIVLIISTIFLTFLQDYTMILVAFIFLLAGLIAPSVAGMKGKDLGRTFWQGVVGVAPAILMILMANSIKYILVEAKILDTLLHGAVNVAGELPGSVIILFIYLIVLVMNFFIPSGSAKAFLLMPLIIPMAQIFGLSPQLCIVAFAFGDGFSNVIYPTNPVLLIGLGIADVSYTRWARFSILFQICNLILTAGLLLLGFAIGY
ncbi:MAG: YfcC family protein [Agathobacter sp.]|nr:YfcC family protein [Agathobacter sp.]